MPHPAGTGLQAVWKKPDSTMLALGGAYAVEPARIEAVLSHGDGFECKGRWQKDESGGFLEMALLCVGGRAPRGRTPSNGSGAWVPSDGGENFLKPQVPRRCGPKRTGTPGEYSTLTGSPAGAGSPPAATRSSSHSSSSARWRGHRGWAFGR
ncbi:hypothetical protein GA0115243_1106104 [Streptomyces sp. ScaeMP-e83]|nr:hypothetical protein GA0115243_1106104 [Streptomyces sp. ScaeMP-e83]